MPDNVEYTRFIIVLEEVYLILVMAALFMSISISMGRFAVNCRSKQCVTS